jgi:hypothetical protein
MTRQYQVPGGPFISETGARQYQIPGGPYVNETTSAEGISRRALILNAGRIQQIFDAQINTGQKPLILDAGRVKQRVAMEGKPLVLVDGRIREIWSNETLII